ncbi:MAG: tetratricopeptide repeat protein [Acidobacteriota bacterium]|nr:tetratricopeptide repeat protein [Acidobacteriota bacterium]
MVLPTRPRLSHLTRIPVLFIFFCFGWSQSSGQKTVSELLQTGRLPEARKILLELAQEDPDNEDLQAVLGQIAFSLKEYGEAAKRFRESASKLSKNPILLLNYTESLLQTKDNQAALEAVERLPEDHFMAQFEAGLILARFGEFPAAERHFKQARAGHPDPLSVAYNLALAQYRLRKFEECAATIEESRRGWTISNVSDPPSAQKQERMLDLLLLAKQEAPVDMLRQAIGRDPGDEINYLAIAERRVEENKLLQAVELVERGLEQLPHSYSLRFKHAHLRYFLAQYGLAEAEYRKAAELRPDLAMPRVGLALVLMETRQLDEAATVLQEVLRRTPLSFYGHYLLGELAVLSGVAPGSQVESKAVEHLKQATALQPDFFFWEGSSPVALAHTSLGKLYLQRSDPASAVRELEKAVQLDPEATPAFYQLSIAYRKLGNKEKERQTLAQVRRLNQQRRELGARKLSKRAVQKTRLGLGGPPG